jgi:hypothetical protein
MYKKKSSSTTATGGDHGMVAGIGLSIMTEVGVSMQEFQFGIMGYPVVGEMIIETIFGEVIHGTIMIYTIVIFKRTGGPGIIPTIGIDRSIENLHITTMGECMVVDKKLLKKVSQVLKYTVQAKPLQVNILKAKPPQANTLKVKPLRATIALEQKERNEV